MSSDDRVATPFGATTTAAEVVDGVDLSGRRAIVTGASSGLGVETARALAGAGAKVTLAVRDVAAGERAAQDIAATTASERLAVRPLDLSDQASIAAFVDAWTGPLDMLVNNAGIMATPELRTREGWEMQLATNHLGHFALSTGLHGALAAASGARVVCVSSVGHVNGGILWDDLNFERRAYDPWQAYSQSKTAIVLFAVEAARRWRSDDVAVNALNPGRIWETNLSRHMDAPPQSFDPEGATGVSVKNAEQGAATSVLLAASPLVEGVTGRYFEDCQEAGPFVESVRRGVAPRALDPDDAARLWRMSEDLVAGAVAVSR
jgi:NAD(P)-dependent dehydrogenase (short-subunit alcohol dehydrogenase family)